MQARRFGRARKTSMKSAGVLTHGIDFCAVFHALTDRMGCIILQNCYKPLYQIPKNITSTGAFFTFSLTEFSELSCFFIFLQNFIFYKKTLAFSKNICYTFRAVTNKQFHHSKAMRGSAW